MTSRVKLLGMLATLLAGPGAWAGGVLQEAARGPVQQVVERVLAADVPTLEGWAGAGGAAATGAPVDGLRPNQVKYLDAFLQSVHTYKRTLKSCFSLMTPGGTAAAEVAQGQAWGDRVPWDEADALYLRIVEANRGVDQRTFVVKDAPPETFWSSGNYEQFLAAMLAKVGAIARVFDALHTEESADRAALARLARHGIAEAGRILREAPAESVEALEQVAQARDELIDALERRLAKVDEAAARQLAERETRTGPAVDTYPDGAKRGEGAYAGGKRTGPWQHFHPNGQRQSEGAYREGRPEGPWKTWRSDGTPREEGAYAAGVRQGPWKEWFVVGRKRSGPPALNRNEGAYANGQREGEWIVTDERTGKRVYRRLYKAGELVESGPVK